ncbi:MAG: holo-ACP synthase [Parachlamydiales bacterium]|jgi:holo-[acyl-carrier protein] synthase
MILGVGTDIIEIARIEKAIERQGDPFLNQVFTANERAYCSRHQAYLRNYAGRFAAKEAILKATGTGLRDGISWQDMDIYNDELGRPAVRLSGKLQNILGDNITVHLSISHSADYATAVAVIEKLD